MFTGIIESVGKVDAIEHREGDAKLIISTGQLDMSDVALGDSIACNGVCLTVVDLSSNSYSADVSGETLNLTTLGDFQAGRSVNLEKALTPTTRLGGHLVSGHIDGVGEIIATKNDSRSIKFDIKVPSELFHYIAKKGSICVDGVSLTVNELVVDDGTVSDGMANDSMVNQTRGNVFSVSLVPHTLKETTAGNYKVGTKVNLEVDLLARYLERLLTGKKTQPRSKISEALLKTSGFTFRRILK